MNRLTQDEILAALYPIPNDLNSMEEGIRFRHEDLPTMTEADLNREYGRVQWCLLFDDNPHYWLVQREERLRALISTGKRDE